MQVSAVDGVLECTDEHYWTQSPNVVVGSLHVRVRNGADEQAILSTVYRIFSRYITHLTVQVDKDPPLDWLLPTEGSKQLGNHGPVVLTPVGSVLGPPTVPM